MSKLARFENSRVEIEYGDHSIKDRYVSLKAALVAYQLCVQKAFEVVFGLDRATNVGRLHTLFAKEGIGEFVIALNGDAITIDQALPEKRIILAPFVKVRLGQILYAQTVGDHFEKAGYVGPVGAHEAAHPVRGRPIVIF